MNIALLEPLQIDAEKLEAFAAELRKRGHQFTAYNTHTTDMDELVQRTKDQDIVMIANHPFSNEVIYQLDRLKMIAVAFTGIDHVGLEACKEKGIDVLNCAGYSDQAVAELVIGMTLNLLRRIKQADMAVRVSGTAKGLTGREIAGKKVGIVGLGNIGMRTAKLFDAFGAEVCYYSRTKKENVPYEYLPIEELLPQCDIVSLHLPLNDETRYFMDDERLGMMKEGAILINCARGPVVMNRILAEHLVHGKLSAVGIDVFDMEPPLPNDYPLLHAPNALLTPHVAYLTEESMARRADIEFDNVLSYLDGEKKNLCKL